jgi:hypothetical protein
MLNNLFWVTANVRTQEQCLFCSHKGSTMSTEGGISAVRHWDDGKARFRRRWVLVQHQLRAYCTDIHVSRTHMPRNVCRSEHISLALQRARKHAFFRLFGCVCRVRTEVHMSACLVLFIYFCMRHGKKFSGSQRVATSLPALARNGMKNVTHPWRKMWSPMTQRRFHVTCSHMLLCVSTRKSARSTIKIACLVSTHTVRLQLDERRNIYRAWSYVQQNCLSARLWLHVVSTQFWC